MTLSYRYNPQAKPQTVLYVRLSTIEQTISAQRQQAESLGYVVDKVIEDHIVPGVTTAFLDREGGQRLFATLREGGCFIGALAGSLGS